MSGVGLCPHCGGELVDAQCPACGDDVTVSSFVHRELMVLLALTVLVVGGFMATRAAAVANRDLRRQDAAGWFETGQRALQHGQPHEAVAALRRATTLDAADRDYRLALAAALVADGQDDGARAVLSGMRDLAPEDGVINLELARIEARHGEAEEAVRHYQNALYGRWTRQPPEALREVRTELIRYLLDRRDRAAALSELLILAGNLPDAAPAQASAGELFLEAGDAGRALERFRRALRLDPRNGPALRGAGRAAFDLGDYAGASRFLRAAVAGDPEAAKAAGLDRVLEVAELVPAHDPLAPRLSAQARRMRLSAALAAAIARIDRCLAGGPGADEMSRLIALRQRASTFQRAARTLDGQADDVLALAAEAEREPSRLCGPPAPLDEALTIVARLHASEPG